MLATEIVKFPDTAVKAFVDTLQASVQPLFLPNVTLMSIMTKWVMHHSNEPFTKKIMAKVLIELDDQFKGKPESDKINFRLLARRLDFQSKSKEQEELYSLYYCLLYAALTERQLENIEEF